MKTITLGKVKLDPNPPTWISGDDPKKFGVKPGVAYEVTDFEIHSYKFNLRLEGIKGVFCSEHFVWVDDTPLTAAIEKFLDARLHPDI